MAATASARLARCVAPRGDFTARLIELEFHFLSQLKLVFEVIINPRPDFFHLGASQVRQRGLNFLKSADGANNNSTSDFEKPGFLF